MSKKTAKKTNTKTVRRSPPAKLLTPEQKTVADVLIETAVMELDSIREDARNAKQYAPAITAVMKKFDLLRDAEVLRQAINRTDDDSDESQLERLIREHLGSLLDPKNTMPAEELLRLAAMKIASQL